MTVVDEDSGNIADATARAQSTHRADLSQAILYYLEENDVGE